MRKLLALILTAGFCGTGCAQGRKPNTEQYRKALADTNASLTECREENAGLHRVVEQYHKDIKMLKKNRQTDAFKAKGGHR